MKNYILLILMLLIGIFVFSQTNTTVSNASLSDIYPIFTGDLSLLPKQNNTIITRFYARYNYREARIYVFTEPLGYYIIEHIKGSSIIYFDSNYAPPKAISEFLPILGGTPADFAYSTRENIVNQLLNPIKDRPFH